MIIVPIFRAKKINHESIHAEHEKYVIGSLVEIKDGKGYDNKDKRRYEVIRYKSMASSYDHWWSDMNFKVDSSTIEISFDNGNNWFDLDIMKNIVNDHISNRERR